MKQLLSSLLILSLFFFTAPSPAHAVSAIAFDAVAGTQDNSGAVTSLSWSHTTTGSNRYLVVLCNIIRTNGSAVVFSSATYNGVAMTELKKATVTDGGSNKVTVIAYGLPAPSTGANTVQVTISGTLDGNHQFGCSSQSYTGVAQAGQPDSTGSNTLTSSSVTTFTVTDTVLATSWLVGAASEDAGDIAGGVAGSGTTYRGSARFNMFAADSNGDVAAGSRTLNWGRGGTPGDLVGITVALLPAAATAATSKPWQFFPF
jgi:hypothetical protein